MGISLRDYQTETIASLVGPEKTDADLVVCATGGGKTKTATITLTVLR